jgi:hypothetical protein
MSINNSAFYGCSNLASANLPNARTLGSYAFSGCFRLSSVVIGLNYTDICVLSNSNAFKSTPFTGYSSYFSGTPVIYVPASKLSAYQTAKNWSYFSKYMTGVTELA